MGHITANEADIIRAREALLDAWGEGSLDAKRPTAWSTYGYPKQLDFERLLGAYERGGAAHGAVHRLLDGCWQELPRIKSPAKDEESPWEKKTAQLLRSIRAWAKFRDLDRRNMVGRYAALIYRVADGKTLDQPLQTASKLVDLVPLYENQLQVVSWITDTNAENFGLPEMYEYRSLRPGATDQAQPEQWVKVHPSRVQLLAEGAVGNFLDGVPLLRAGFNALVDLEKVSGGSAESYLKNSARTLVFQYGPDAQVEAFQYTDAEGNTATKTVREVHEDQARKLNKNTDSSIVIKGGEASTLQTATSDPSPAFQVAANLFAAAVRIPFTILFGQQTGRLASDEDRDDFNARCKSRRDNDLTPMLEEFVTRMQACGLIEAGEFEIEWPPLGAPTDAERLDNVNKMTAAMQQAASAGLTEPLFDANELRAAAGYEERADDGMPTEEDRRQADEAAAREAAAQQP